MPAMSSGGPPGHVLLVPNKDPRLGGRSQHATIPEIVVSPVRVRVLSSREVPASSPLSRGHLVFRASGGAPRMRGEVPNEVLIAHARSDHLR